MWFHSDTTGTNKTFLILNKKSFLELENVNKNEFEEFFGNIPSKEGSNMDTDEEDSEDYDILEVKLFRVLI